MGVILEPDGHWVGELGGPGAVLVQNKHSDLLKHTSRRHLCPSLYYNYQPYQCAYNYFQKHYKKGKRNWVIYFGDGKREMSFK